jgi:serine/threonine-protein kinase
VESRYKIVERIDSGGMAEVFKGRARAIHGIEKLVAIKRILPHLARNRKFVAMFLDEARLAVYLNHANIVQVFDIARSDGDYFIVMEFVEGANLRTLLEVARSTGRPFPLEKAIYIAAEVCRGLAYAHDRSDFSGRPLKIVHRDVSPPNVLLSYEGEVKLVDFGLAKAASQIEESDPDILKGKLGYMSPEQAWGHDVDHRADVFAAGILLWEMLANRRLFRGESDLQTLEMVRRAEVPPPSTHNDRVTPDLESAVMRALAQDPAQRYADARQFADELWRFLFANGLKVTPQELGEWVREITGRLERAESSARVIDQMIQEEILRLVSIESYDLPEDSPPPSFHEGSRPIKVEDLSVARERREQTQPKIALTPLSDILEPDTEAAAAPERPAAPAPQPRSRAAWWILAIMVLGGIAGGLFLLLREGAGPTAPRAPPAHDARGR